MALTTVVRVYLFWVQRETDDVSLLHLYLHWNWMVVRWTCWQLDEQLKPTFVPSSVCVIPLTTCQNYTKLLAINDQIYQPASQATIGFVHFRLLLSCIYTDWKKMFLEVVLCASGDHWETRTPCFDLPTGKKKLIIQPVNQLSFFPFFSVCTFLLVLSCYCPAPLPSLFDEYSLLLFKDVDKTQTEIMRHHTSISELKRSFMESVPEPRPSEWDKRLSTNSPLRTLNINGQLQPAVSLCRYCPRGNNCFSGVRCRWKSYRKHRG